MDDADQSDLADVGLATSLPDALRTSPSPILEFLPGAPDAERAALATRCTVELMCHTGHVNRRADPDS